MTIEKKLTIEELKEEYKDVLENAAINNLIELKRKGDRGLILTSNYPEISEETYIQKFKKYLPSLTKILKSSF
jgi:hypothetical protein